MTPCEACQKPHDGHTTCTEYQAMVGKTLAVAAVAGRRMDVVIRKDGIWLGGQLIHGVIEWNIKRNPSQGLTEVHLVLVTDKIDVQETAQLGCVL